MAPTHTANGLLLSELIRHIASELREARHLAGQKQDPVLDFSGCELEMAVTLKAEGKAGLKIWFIEAGFSGDRTTISKIKLSFGRPPGATVQFSATQFGEEPPNPQKERKMKQRNPATRSRMES